MDRASTEHRITQLLRVLGSDAPSRPNGLGLDGWLELLEDAYSERRAS